MNKSQLVDSVAVAAGLTKAQAEKAVNSTFSAISGELEGGGSFSLIGFGTFSITEKPARTGINPKTREKIEIAAKKVAKFKPGKALADAVNK